MGQKCLTGKSKTPVHAAYLSHSRFQWDKLTAECQNPVWGKKSLSFNTWVGGKYECVRLYMRYCVCGFWIGTAVWFFDSNDVGPSQIDRRRRREWEQEWETRQEENESNGDREKRKKSNSEAIVDNSRFFSPSGCLFLSSISIHHRLSIQGHWLMPFNMAGQRGSLSLRKWG